MLKARGGGGDHKRGIIPSLVRGVRGGGSPENFERFYVLF